MLKNRRNHQAIVTVDRGAVAEAEATVVAQDLGLDHVAHGLVVIADQDHFRVDDHAVILDHVLDQAQLNIEMIADDGEEAIIVHDLIIIVADDLDQENIVIFEIIADVIAGIIVEMDPVGIIEVAVAVGMVIIVIEIIETKAVKDIDPDQEVVAHMIVKRNGIVRIMKANEMVNVNRAHNH